MTDAESNERIHRVQPFGHHGTSSPSDLNGTKTLFLAFLFIEAACHALHFTGRV